MTALGGYAAGRLVSEIERMACMSYGRVVDTLHGEHGGADLGIHGAILLVHGHVQLDLLGVLLVLVWRGPRRRHGPVHAPVGRVHGHVHLVCLLLAVLLNLGAAVLEPVLSRC
jgi:hypothetical protein